MAVHAAHFDWSVTDSHYWKGPLREAGHQRRSYLPRLSHHLDGPAPARRPRADRCGDHGLLLGLDGQALLARDQPDAA